MSTNNTASSELDFDTPAAKRHRNIRALKDKFASAGIAFGGISVIVAILLIFFYLLYEVAPLFESAKIERWQDNEQTVAPYAVPGEGNTLYLTMEEQAEIGLRVTDTGTFSFFNTRNGEVLKKESVSLPEGVTVTSFALASEYSGIFALGYSNGQAQVFQHKYKSTYPNGVRVITPGIEYPLGAETIQVSDGPLEVLALNGEEDTWTLVGGQQSKLNAAQISLTENLITEEVMAESDLVAMPDMNIPANKILLMPDRRWMLISGEDSKLGVVDMNAEGGPKVTQLIDATPGNITSFELLLGGNSLLISDDKGETSQWFLVRNEDNEWLLTKIRDFKNGSAPITGISIEHRRKGFAAITDSGDISFFTTTAERNSLNAAVAKGNVDMIALAPRSNALLVEQNGELTLWKIHNEHPEISWSALWEKVWYEGYQEPEFTWQSSASTNDFEPKYSLMPLAFGTLKAAFYAMLLGTPLAICGAIYTAYFMVPAMRRKVKPFIELMEALPTVILGFLAGLWLAPFMEVNLAGIFVTLLVLPVAIIAFAYAWACAPKAIRFLIPEGWDAALLVPVVIIATMFSFWIAPGIEQVLFGTEMRYWVSNELGIPYDQRNALVVGIAMGFAVIPTIFSITEDAIFAVPKHLSYGSLALGATPWQTLVRVVMPTASPGIFSAVMIGMGRAVGETMIVLMATGNTPIMDVNIFEGMRTLAANIAVEMPESEVGSTHYRILFLAAFVLFLFTFFVNTLAELVRQRLRKKYGSL
ncbi:ABC transporter permease subunit [Neptuniibacter caesariensis]|uniref:Binding-protein-dependent transport systems inner membrane component n=1 Tax=Neptuniibacter caesariensis TaxID=207954 RepID=A0A7U8CA07_NEPCE|nr:ABC transporter permease subunit [Neptuniibacter caesariensis]EAR62509.1 Binding-protein-dependent transport systems inner membrane component [Oceanospirillum sp. MED92] [Neptuniibacter caesariensis]